MAHQETKIVDANAKESSLLDILMILENAYHHAAIVGYNFSLVWSFEWVFTTPAIAHHIYGLPISDSKSEAYQNAGDWLSPLNLQFSILLSMLLCTTVYCKKNRTKINAFYLLNIGGPRINFHLFCTQ
jgi:maltose/moltooligosaccharide transporter